MCIILGPGNISNVRIYTADVSVNGIDGKLIIYKNNLVSAEENVILVVVPTDKNISLVSLGDNGIKTFINYCDEASNCLITYDEKNIPRNITNSNKIPIYQIGDYKISVAYSVKELIEQIDQTEFNRTKDLDERINTINNKVLFPFENKAIIVCKANHSIKDVGFGCVYYSKYNFIPLCQEISVKDKNDIDQWFYTENDYKEIYDYDFTIYKLNSIKPNKHITFYATNNTQYDKDGNTIYMVNNECKNYIGRISNDDITFLKKIIRKIEITETRTGIKQFMDLISYDYIGVCPIKTSGINQNITL